jgi:hypothetical protein
MTRTSEGDRKWWRPLPPLASQERRGEPNAIALGSNQAKAWTAVFRAAIPGQELVSRQGGDDGEGAGRQEQPERHPELGEAAIEPAPARRRILDHQQNRAAPSPPTPRPWQKRFATSRTGALAADPSTEMAEEEGAERAGHVLDAVEQARRDGGLRLIAVTDTTPGYLLMHDPAMTQDTKSALADTYW